MANPYTSVSIANYNANPPSDDGANTAANEITWAKHKDKLGDPLKTLAEAINTNVLTAFGSIFGNNVTTASTTSTLTSTVQGKLVSATGTITLTLPAISSVGANFSFVVKNAGTGTVTLDGASAETINSSATLDLAEGDWALLVSDGSNWTAVVSTSLPFAFQKSHLAGLTLSNNGTDADHDIDIAAGECRGADDDENIILTALTKQIDATWAAGTNAGGLSSSLTAPANDTWYHVHAIVVGGAADVGFDTSVTAANLVTDHSATAYRRIGSVLTDGSANIVAFKQYGDEFVWTAVVTDYSPADPGASEVTTTLTVPLGVEVRANIAASFRMTTGGAGDQDFYTSFYHPDVTAPTPSNMPMVGAHNSNGETVSAATGGAFYVRTNTSSQIQHISTNPTGTMSLQIGTMGWIDDLGRFA